MWRVPVNPPIPVYTRDIGDAVKDYHLVRNHVQIEWNNPAAPVVLTLACPIGFRYHIERIVVMNLGTVNVDVSWINKAGNVYAYWADGDQNACIIYAPGNDTANGTGVPSLDTRPLPIPRLDEGESVRLNIAFGGGDVGGAYIYYIESKDIGY